MKDRILLLIVGIAAAAASILLLRLEGQYSSIVTAVFAAIAVIGYFKRRK